MNFRLEIEKMRNNFEHNRPKDMRLHRPWWMFADEELSKIYTEKKMLFEKGQVYYSCILQANIKLFRKFPPFDYPAQIVYSTSLKADENPLLLRETIDEIYSYKYSDEVPPAQWAEIVDNIRNEKDRTAFTIECGEGDSEIKAKMQTIMVFRKHLPTGILQGRVLPVIACPDVCDSAIVLPSEYWSEDFKLAWLTQL